MGQTSDQSLSIKATSIPEEGIRREWTIDPELITGEDYNFTVNRPVEASGKLGRSGMRIYFDGRLSALLGLSCSRCTEDFEYELTSDVLALFTPEEENKPGKHGKEIQLEAEDMDVSYYQGDEINLLGPLQDQIVLETPMQPLCAEDCKGLCVVCGANLNLAGCSCERSDGDPRFAELKKLLQDQEDKNAGT